MAVAVKDREGWHEEKSGDHARGTLRQQARCTFAYLEGEVNFFFDICGDERRDTSNELAEIDRVVSSLVEHGEQPIQHLSRIE